MMNFTVTPELAGQTLAAILRNQSPGKSWSQVREQVAKSVVRVNQIVCLDAARRLKTGDCVHIGEPSVSPRQLTDQVRLLHVDHHLAVVEKPSGLTTERRPEERNWPAKRKALQPTLDEVLPSLLSGNAGVRRKSAKRQAAGGVILVHRLDRDTSGVMVVARTAEAAHGLTAQFRKHSADRAYRAVVVGHPGTVTIRSQLVRDRGDGLRGSADSAPVGKLAITHVREIERLGGFSIVECRLETGRTNQIRIHLAERNCPVCGEVKYNRRPDGSVIDDASQAPRLALHAAALSLVHPITGSPLSFRSPWPVELENLVLRLRREAS